MAARTRRASASTIRFDATVYTVDETTILRLPDDASRKLPSRGQVAVHGTIDRRVFDTVLEPDGRRGHWMRIDDGLKRAARLRAGATATLEIAPSQDWPEPSVPPDFGRALATAPEQIRRMWTEITPMARWEWVRWINATRNPDTRKRRVEVSIAKMTSGKRRPCCFDLSSCTDPDLSKNGRLLDASSA